ncbi:MAG: hypothetical protein ACR2GG_05165 [Gemmatimonadaceae bacterium]
MARRERNECLITDYLVGEYGLAERLATGPVARSLLRKLPGSYVSYRIPWDRMDLLDPERPRTTCAKFDLPKAD